MATAVPACSAQFRRAIAMPNIVPPVTTVQGAAAYPSASSAPRRRRRRRRVRAAMACTSPTARRPSRSRRRTRLDRQTVKLYRRARRPTRRRASPTMRGGGAARGDGAVRAARNSGAILAQFCAILRRGPHPRVRPAALRQRGDHCRSTSSTGDFISERLPSLLAANPGLRVIVKYMTTRHRLRAQGGQRQRHDRRSTSSSAATRCSSAVPPRNSAQFSAARNRPPPPPPPTGDQPRLHLPILKREEDRRALLAGIRTGCDRLFLGTDSAPHAVGRKARAAARACFGALRVGVRRARFRPRVLAQFWRKFLGRQPPAGTPGRSRRRAASTTSRRSRRPTAPTSTGYR